MKDLILAAILLINFIVALAITGAYDAAKISGATFTISALLIFALTFICFKLIERKSEK